MPRTLTEIGAALRTIHASMPWLSAYEVVEGAVACEEPDEQKRMILAARDPDVAFLSDETAEALIRDLGLQGA